ncbi:MAG: T9SS type A sorting domain-containing protein [Candidatus Kapabacteria bacterium]|nr:T9SS type A sorting domain-containing protein [Candidatus Kapabacteria bacterium]
MSKKILFILLILSPFGLVGTLTAQSLQIHAAEDVIQTAEAKYYKSTLEMTNISDTSVFMTTKVHFNEIAEGHELFLCILYDCLKPATEDFTAGHEVKILPGETTEPNFYEITLVANGVKGYTEVEYTFYVTEAPDEDFIVYTQKYYIGISSSAEDSDLTGGVFSVPYPNPASSQTSVDYTNSSSSELILYNSTGEKVDSYAVPAGDGKLMLPVSNLAPGAYFYNLVNGGEIVKTERLVISR